MQDLNINLDEFAHPEELLQVADVFEILATYAKTKARAMRDRINGNINDALAQEQQCDCYYARLPDWVKW